MRSRGGARPGGAPGRAGSARSDAFASGGEPTAKKGKANPAAKAPIDFSGVWELDPKASQGAFATTGVSAAIRGWCYHLLPLDVRNKRASEIVEVEAAKAFTFQCRRAFLPVRRGAWVTYLRSKFATTVGECVSLPRHCAGQCADCDDFLSSVDPVMHRLGPLLRLRPPLKTRSLLRKYAACWSPWSAAR